MSGVRAEATFADSNNRSACDHCRVRKTKCDRKEPCSACVTARVSCKFSSRRPEKRQRVLLSAKYEDALQDINEHLTEISSTLRTIASREEVPVSASVLRSSSLAPQKPEMDHLLLDGSANRLGFRGASSFHAQAADLEKRMTLNLPNAVNGGSSIYSWLPTTNMRHQQVVRLHTDSPGHSLQATYPELASRSLPPMEIACRLLHVARTEPQRVFSDVPVIEVEDVSNIWRKVYLLQHDISVFDWITLNVILLYLLVDLDVKHYDKVGVTNQKVQEMTESLEQNCKAAIRSLRLCIAASMAACQATTLLASYCVKSGHHSTACWFITFAARFALDLGLHRSSSDSRSQANGMFWHIYAMDKYLSFTMGRTATVHHYDITTEPRLNLDGNLLTSNGVGLEFLNFAHLASQIHLQLFSATAQDAPNDIRYEHANGLATQLHLELKQLRSLSPSGDLTSKSAFDCLSVVAHCYLTLVYQFLSPIQVEQHGSGDVVSIAREALEIFLELGRRALAKSLASWSRLLNTILALTPLTPILVLAGRTISDPSHDHLDLLEPAIRLVELVAEKSSAVKEIWDVSSRLSQMASSARGREVIRDLDEDRVGI